MDQWVKEITNSPSHTYTHTPVKNFKVYFFFFWWLINRGDLLLFFASSTTYTAFYKIQEFKVTTF